MVLHVTFLHKQLLSIWQQNTMQFVFVLFSVVHFLYLIF